MKMLRLLSGMVAWIFRRTPGRRAVPAPGSGVSRGGHPDQRDEIPTWYESTSLGEWCDIDTHCEACRPNGDCDLCDTIDGWHMDAVAEYAQTCDGCGDLTMNVSLVEDHSTRLSYCRKCCGKRRRHPHRHGWYSVKNDKALGHYYCTLADGGTAKVTNVTNSPTGGLAGWPDAVYVGETVPSNEGGIQRERKPWTPPWSKKCQDGTCDHKDGPCADRRQASLIRRFHATGRR